MSWSVMPTCATPASTMLVDSGAKMRSIVVEDVAVDRVGSLLHCLYPRSLAHCLRRSPLSLLMSMLKSPRI